MRAAGLSGVGLSGIKEASVKRVHIIPVFVFFFACAAVGGSTQQHEHGKSVQTSAAKAVLAAPSSIHEEHVHLHQELEAALASGGKTAAAAKAVADVLVPHFEAEEAYAMPPLGLLEAIAHDQPVSAEQAREAITMAGQLRTHYEQMIQEHRQIEAALKGLAAAAKEEHKTGALAFAETLALHAKNEEQVLYPATLLVGKYLKLRQTAGSAADSDRAPVPVKR